MEKNLATTIIQKPFFPIDETKMLTPNSPTCYDLVTTCFTNGDRTNGSVCGEGAVIQYGYNDRGDVLSDGDPATNSLTEYLATAGQVGSVWGTAYNKFTNKLYVSAFIRRHSDVGAGGLGAIYEIDMDNPPVNNGSPCTPIAPWMDINNLTCLGAGATLMPTVPTAASRGLGGKSSPSQDAWAFDKIGKEGIGDIELSADGSTLYVTDFTNQQIVVIDMATQVCTQVPITSPCGGTSDYRPFGITEHNGEVYIGVVCDGTGATPDISHHVVQFNNPITPTGTTITATWTTSQWGPNGFDVWQSWSDDYAADFTETDIDPDPNTEDFYVRRTQSMITDIEFAANGNMVIGMTSRDGFQLGWVNHPPTSTSYTIKMLTYGDIQYATENAGNFTPNQPNAQWTFYETADFSEFNDTAQEGVFIGGLVVSDCCGTEYVTAHLQDPYFFESNGTTWIDNATGQTQGGTLNDGRLELVFIGGGSPDNFGKAIALGDLEMLIPDCSMTINEITTLNCTDNGGNNFTADIQVEVSWIEAPDGEAIEVTLDGGMTQTIASGMTSPQTVTFSSVIADGSAGHTILAQFATTTSCSATANIKFPAPCPNDVAVCASASGCLGGNVFEDYNCNGTDDANEPGVQGIQIQVYDCNNNLVGTGYSDAEGDWQVCGLMDGTAYRIEHILPEAIACWATPTHVASGGNQSDVQFLTAPACTQFSVSSPADYCHTDNPPLVTPCYVDGDPTGGGTSGMGDWVVGFPYDHSGAIDDGASYPQPSFKVDGQTLGATWGMAYHPQSQSIFTSALIKRHSGLGVDGTDAIYRIDVSGATPAASSFINLSTYPGVNTGADPRDGSANNTLNANYGNDSRDLNAFNAVGKVAIGDIDISEDGRTLYAINLNDRTLVEMNVGTVPTVPAAVQTYSIATAMPTLYPGGCGSANDYRPWALKVHKGLVYVGVVCSAENSQITSDLHAYIISFDPANPGGGFSPVFDFDLNYTREDLLDYGGQNINAAWRPWINNWNQVTIEGGLNAGAPQPILSDIEFDTDGSMVIGLMDRFGHQSGFENLSTNLSDNNLYIGIAGGDVVRVCNIGGTFQLEGAAGCAYNGPNEYYDEDFFFHPNVFGNALRHGELSFGTLALLKGKGQGEVVAGIYDPYYIQSGGVIYWNNQNGNTSHKYELYNFDNTTPGESFGKANGLGDLELLCAPAPLEIGNYVWCDSLENGIQDACERGINNILVQLFDRNGNLVGQDTTSNSGQYYFNENNVDTTGITINGSGIAAPNSGSFTGMSYSTQYFIVFGNAQFAAGEFNNGSEMFGITSMINAGSNDNIDSDVDGSNLTSGSLGARPDGLPFIEMTTSATGCGDHKYDMGVICHEELFSLGNRVFYDDDNSGDQNGVEAGIDGVQLQLLNNDGSVYDSDPNTAGIQALTVTTANGGYYRFDDLPAGDYIVEVIADNFNSGNPLNMFESSTGVNQEAAPDTDGDLNDNGLDTQVSGATRSGIVTLGTLEPTGESEPASYGTGSTTGMTAADENSNLTVDFGFYPIPVDNVFPQPGFPPCDDQPCHVINNDLRMGATLSADAANGDATDDADGTVFPNNLRAGTTILVRTEITNNTGSDAYLYAWVDWNNDDDFDDPGENFIVATYPAAMFSGTFAVSNGVTIPSATSTTDEIALRFRLSTNQAAISTPCAPAGCASDGEVEDYVIMLECPETICLPVQIQLNRE